MADSAHRSPPAPGHVYRPSKQLSWELSQHTAVFLSSGQHLEGLDLLTNLVTAGTAISTIDTSHPALIPPLQHLAVAATLIVHPSLNTKSRSPDSIRASNAAVRYLRLVNKTVGPVNARFNCAFDFEAAGTARRIVRSRDDDSRPIKSKLANEGGVWNKADDLWHVVGWGFNCSLKHRQRWDRWRLWLELMLDIMEDDWMERRRLQEAAMTKDQEAGKYLLEQSIIMRMITAGDSEVTGSRQKKIISAVFADGSSKALIEFREVFKNETTARKEDVPSGKRTEQEEEKDIFDLNMDEDEDDDENDFERETPRRAARLAISGRRPSIVSLSDSSEHNEDVIERPSVSGLDGLGGFESVQLRERLLALLVSVAEIAPGKFTSRDNLFDRISERLRPLHVSSFEALVANSKLASETQAVFCSNTLIPYLRHSVIPLYDLEPPSQEDLEKHLLPSSANSSTCVDNAKVSILLQSIMQQMLPRLEPTKGLVDALKIGFRNRPERKPGSAQKRKHMQGQEPEAQAILHTSRECLEAMLEMMNLKDSSSVSSGPDCESQSSLDSDTRNASERQSSLKGAMLSETDMCLSSYPSSEDLDAQEHDHETLQRPNVPRKKMRL